MQRRAAGGEPLALVLPDHTESGLGTTPDGVVGYDGTLDVVVSIKRDARRRDAEVASRPRQMCWDEASIRAELSSFVAGHDMWPTYDEFVTAGHKRLRDAIGRYRGPKWWAMQLGLSGGDRRRGGVRRWTDDTIRDALAAFLGDRDTWPTRREFQGAGRGGLYAAVRSYGGCQRWAQELGVRRADPVRRLAPSHPPRRSSPVPASLFWSEERILRELTQALDGRDEWPPYSEFVASGHRGVYRAICGNGGPALWAGRVGVSWVRRKGGPRVYWTDDRVRERLADVLAARATWPTTTEFAALGEAALLATVRRRGGVERWAMEFRVARQPCHHASRAPTSPRVWDDAAILAAIAPLVHELGRWPTKGEFRRAGLGKALAAVYGHGGSAHWQLVLGVAASPAPGPVPNRTAWTETRIERELLSLCRGRHAWPTVIEFRELGALALYRAASSHGGISHWRERIGL
jgi:hypothetical protein